MLQMPHSPGARIVGEDAVEGLQDNPQMSVVYASHFPRRLGQPARYQVRHSGTRLYKAYLFGVLAHGRLLLTLLLWIAFAEYSQTPPIPRYTAQ